MKDCSQRKRKTTRTKFVCYFSGLMIKALKIYNAHDFPTPAQALVLATVWDLFEAYVKPRSKKALASYQLNCLRQEDLTFDEFHRKAKPTLGKQRIVSSVIPCFLASSQKKFKEMPLMKETLLPLPR